MPENNEPPSARAMRAAKAIHKRPLKAGVPVIVTVTEWADIIDAAIHEAMAEPAAPPATIAVTCDVVEGQRLRCHQCNLSFSRLEDFAKHAEHIQRHTTVTLEPVSLTDAPPALREALTMLRTLTEAANTVDVEGTEGDVGLEAWAVLADAIHDSHALLKRLEDAAPPQKEEES